ncbi:GNAT family N-acetyltransferase [Spelaeicoccus albus]|uniref:GNAT superfamily N-acetyltransferase n=1 Tax=Spelaeicoccus albus TaxID=1280376 RepID=A0A7Z0D5L9_9MICO|nr:GNAT family N-acetyltransferase [Spelaeicoccus albus]NYI69345.1 GNAT superfamily N-acetyltransferase [Spelaeicoccus albus]
MTTEVNFERNGIVIEPMARPRSLDDADAAGLHGLIALERECALTDFGYTDLVHTARERFAELAHEEYSRIDRLLAWDGDLVVGRASIGRSLVDDTDRARAHVAVLPDRRRQGIGSALFVALTEFCRRNGRSVLVSDSDHPAGTACGRRDVRAKSGVGEIPDDAAARFALARGFVLEQVERYSVLPMPADARLVARLEAEAIGRANAPHDYRLVTWTDRCPDEWVDDLAWLSTRMSTDAPSAGIEAVEESWDAARVRDNESTLRQQRRTALVCAAEHVPSGRLVGFTEIVVPDHDETIAFQNDTLVLAEHRGRKLGQFVKTGNLRRLAAARPAVRRVHTWNAAENSYMLSVNVALGFTTAGWCAQWQKRMNAIS